MKLNRHGSWFLLVALATVAIAAPQQRLFTWESKKGDFAIRQIQSQLIEGAPDSGFKVEFKGSPLTGFSKSQSIDFTGTTLNATIKTASGGSMFLDSGTLTGQVTLWVDKGKASEQTLTTSTLSFKENADRSGANVTLPQSFVVVAKRDGAESARITAQSGSLVLSGKADQNRTITSAQLSGALTAKTSGTRGSATYSTTLSTQSLRMREGDVGSVFTLSNAFQFVDQESAGGSGSARKFSLSGSGGTLTLPSVFGASKRTGRPIKSASISGKVILVLETTPAKGGNAEPSVIRATGDKLTMDASGRIELSGNVEMETDSLKGSSDFAYILVDENMKVLKYGAGGNPAKADYKPSSGGGR
ncbi:hypothetical protein QPK87_10440 [Kamptonema cortianum]|nr:hypothetical protein [Geitlerinema splendidum]MDK3156994.1 hypothetical protein [Kamptonema cortianum]